MNSTSNSANEDMVFDISAREGAPGFIGMFFNIYLKTGGMLTSSDVSHDTRRLQRTTHFMISLIPGKEKREQVRSQLDQDISNKLSEAEKKNGGTVDLGEKEDIIDQCCLEIIGNITDFIDEHIGISIENKLGSV